MESTVRDTASSPRILVYWLADSPGSNLEQRHRWPSTPRNARAYPALRPSRSVRVLTARWQLMLNRTRAFHPVRRAAHP